MISIMTSSFDETGGGVEQVASEGYKKRFKERLVRARTDASFETAAEFATALGIEPHRYRKYEREDKEGVLPSYEVLIQISLVAKRSLNWRLTRKK